MRVLALLLLLIISLESGLINQVSGLPSPNKDANKKLKSVSPSKSESNLSFKDKVKQSEATIAVPSSQISDAIIGRKNQREKEMLYEAYNMLHTLAQDFHKPFDAPAVIVVGHQTSGKSALIEGLMGFQFNQVGGGTKTRRPVALRMQYNPNCLEPSCFLTLENGKEEPRSLEDIQAYIEAENKRLERDPTRCFDPREINVRMEYKYCPNMILIDTPGMIHAPRGKQLTPQQRVLARAAREAEELVLSKIKCQDYIILCVEDTTDWKHATTRNIVMQADPELSRTVLVTTKLDTKLPQFSENVDLDDFISAPLIQKLFPRMLGGPFFTSVPCGRVGLSKEFNTNSDFVRALRETEGSDRRAISMKMGQIPGLSNVGVTRLRKFLETRVDDSYRRNVAKIVPMLQGELRVTESKLTNVETELSNLSLERLKKGADRYREKFAKELAEAIHGTVKVSPDEWGETSDLEQVRGGSFFGSSTTLSPQQSESWKRLMEVEVGNTNHKLFGGAQYHRALREFTAAVRHMKNPQVSENEIANAAGMGEVHDGVNFMRAACVIAIEKAQLSFEPMLEALRHRSVHIMRRLFPIIEQMATKATSLHPSSSFSADIHTKPLQDMIKRIYFKFIDQQIDECLEKCRDDLHGMTRFVTWDVDGKGGSSGIYKSLPTPKKMAEIYTIAVDTRSRKTLEQEKQARASSVQQALVGGRRGAGAVAKAVPQKVLEDWKEASELPVTVADSGVGSATTSLSTRSANVDSDDALVAEHYDLLQLMEEMLAGRNEHRTSTVVTAIVQFISRSWTDHFARTVAMKLNCFFLMPFIDEFPNYLRNELNSVYESGMEELFDISEARSKLQVVRNELVAECEANAKLQKRFDQINAQMRATKSVGSSLSAESLSAGLGGSVEDEDLSWPSSSNDDDAAGSRSSWNDMTSV